ncbi:hypothetical protein J1N35_041901, partial [Gossypium stocksii]
MAVGNGNNVRCWEDAWVPNLGPLKRHVPAHANVNQEHYLSEMVMETGIWNLDFLRLWLTEDIIQHIVSVPPPMPFAGSEDALHALRDCQVAKDVWLQVISPNLQTAFFSSNLIDWLSSNLEDHVDGISMRPNEIINVSYSWANQFSSMYRDVSRGDSSSPCAPSFLCMCFYLNRDGVIQTNIGLSAAGGVIRDNMGKRILDTT